MTGDRLPAPARQVDARGLACPRPIIELAAAVHAVDAGEVVELWADDPAAGVDVPVWCRMRRQRLVDVQDADGALRFRVQKTSG